MKQQHDNRSVAPSTQPSAGPRRALRVRAGVKAGSLSCGGCTIGVATDPSQYDPNEAWGIDPTPF